MRARIYLLHAAPQAKPGSVRKWTDLRIPEHATGNYTRIDVMFIAKIER
jgi:hypothetical protein